jgi:hypothetical protein
MKAEKEARAYLTNVDEIRHLQVEIEPNECLQDNGSKFAILQ